MEAPLLVTATPQRLGQTLFRLRSLTPVPVVAVCLTLVWLMRGEPGPGGPEVSVAFDVLGLMLCLAGQALRFYTLGWVPEGTSGQDLHLQASTLNTAGPYARVRNPLYLGNLGIVLGLLCIAHVGWVYVLALAFFFGEYFFIIRAEEAFLRGRFGASFDAYVARVPRWVPRLTAANEGTLRAGRFDASRALKKEVNPFSAWALGALAVLTLQWWGRGTLSTMRVGLVTATAVAVLTCLLLVKALKKGWLR